MIRLNNINAGYGNHKVLENIDAQFKENTITSVIGNNGCGKSTLLKVMGGLIKPESGDILLDDINILNVSDKDRAKQISYLPQSRTLPVISAGRMVLHGRFPYLSYPRRYSKEDKIIANHAMEQVGIGQLKDRNMSYLSGGERQKVYLAMALAQDTNTILLDEPTTFLDLTYQLEVLKLLAVLKLKGKTIVTVIHDINLALRYSDNLLVLKDGRAVFYGTPSEVFESGILEEVFKVKAHRILDEKNGEFFYFS